jgi:hypothetical protein
VSFILRNLCEEKKVMSFSRLVSATLLSSCLVLQGCGSVKKSLGIEKDAPDEFSVDPSIQPLDMPPDFFVLPKPQPGIPRPQDAQALQAKKEKILGSTPEKASPTTGQKALLEMAGVSEKQENIRQEVDKDSKIVSAKGKPVLERLGIKKTKDENVINPYEEVAELEQQGIPVNHHASH